MAVDVGRRTFLHLPWRAQCLRRLLSIAKYEMHTRALSLRLLRVHALFVPMPVCRTIGTSSAYTQRINAQWHNISHRERDPKDGLPCTRMTNSIDVVLTKTGTST